MYGIDKINEPPLNWQSQQTLIKRPQSPQSFQLKTLLIKSSGTTKSETNQSQLFKTKCPKTKRATQINQGKTNHPL